MSKLKRLAKLDDNLVQVEVPISDDELQERTADYLLLSPNQFSKKYRSLLFQPVKLNWRGKTFEVQLNACTDPYCKWYGLPQKKFDDVRNKPSRYKLSSPRDGVNRINCNPDPHHPDQGYMTWDCLINTMSNWSACEEIARLETIGRIQDIEPEYEFHRDYCTNIDSTPFTTPTAFYKRGKSSSNSQKWQCKSCRKITNVLPKRKESFGYHQQRNDVLHSLALALLNRTPVKRTCEILQIGSKTYYTKLEWLYRRCLEFLDRHESMSLASKSFDSIWINTDKLQYNLNNVRKKGHGGKRYDNLEDKHLQTHIVVSSDVHSRYVFRSDIAYDWNVGLTHVEVDTLAYLDDHLDDFSRKNARLRFSYAPQPPTLSDTQTESEYLSELNEFIRRGKYIDGLHVNSTYTTYAQLWLLKHTINAKEWRFITDDDSSIQTALFRAFSREIRLGEAHHFLCQVNKSKNLQTAFKEYQDGRNQLVAWGASNGIVGNSISKLAYLQLKKIFETHNFHIEVPINGKLYRKWANNPLEHPIPSIDQGWYQVNCTTDLSAYEPKQIANMVLQVNDKATNAFMQQVRRRINILERPLVTARGDGKSYIYANFNPKYAQYALTILRTFYNFCLPFRSWDKKKLTPAQRLGLTNKQFTIKDIIYFM